MEEKTKPIVLRESVEFTEHFEGREALKKVEYLYFGGIQNRTRFLFGIVLNNLFCHLFKCCGSRFWDLRHLNAFKRNINHMIIIYNY